MVMVLAAAPEDMNALNCAVLCRAVLCCAVSCCVAVVVLYMEIDAR